MKICVHDWEQGVKFRIIATTEPERVLLMACVKPYTGPLTSGEEVTDFFLTLPVVPE